MPVTAPRPLIESEVALETDQESVALPPPAKGEIATGEAVKEEIVGTVALLPANGIPTVEVDPEGGTASFVCPGTSCRAGIVCDPKAVAITGAPPPGGTMRLCPADEEVTVIVAMPSVLFDAFKSVAG